MSSGCLRFSFKNLSAASILAGTKSTTRPFTSGLVRNSMNFQAASLSGALGLKHYAGLGQFLLEPRASVGKVCEEPAGDGVLLEARPRQSSSCTNSTSAALAAVSS